MEGIDGGKAMWIRRNVLPHEGVVRRWLRAVRAPLDHEDLIQECYCRFLALEDPLSIRNPRAYFFRMARSLIVDHVRSARVVNIASIARLDMLSIPEEGPSAERTVAARQELAAVLALLARLPERCRRVIELRKIVGLSQREVAETMKLTEAVVENDLRRGLKAMLKLLESNPADGQSVSATDREGPDVGSRRYHQ